MRRLHLTLIVLVLYFGFGGSVVPAHMVLSAEPTTIVGDGKAGIWFVGRFFYAHYEPAGPHCNIVHTYSPYSSGVLSFGGRNGYVWAAFSGDEVLTLVWPYIQAIERGEHGMGEPVGSGPLGVDEAGTAWMFDPATHSAMISETSGATEIIQFPTDMIVGEVAPETRKSAWLGLRNRNGLVRVLDQRVVQEIPLPGKIVGLEIGPGRTPWFAVVDRSSVSVGTVQNGKPILWHLPLVPDPAGFNQGVRLTANDSFVWVAEADQIARINSNGEYSMVPLPANRTKLYVAAIYATPSNTVWVSASGLLWTLGFNGVFTLRPLEKAHCDPNQW